MNFTQRELAAIEDALSGKITELFAVSRIMRRDDLTYINDEVIFLQRLKRKVSEARRSGEVKE